jgi:hypothetical protein
VAVNRLQGSIWWRGGYVSGREVSFEVPASACVPQPIQIVKSPGLHVTVSTRHLSSTRLWSAGHSLTCLSAYARGV